MNYVHVCTHNTDYLMTLDVVNFISYQLPYTYTDVLHALVTFYSLKTCYEYMLSLHNFSVDCLEDTCNGNTCSGNGTCVNGTCLCDPTYSGDVCQYKGT